MRAALWQSVAEHSEDANKRERAADLLEVLTPVMKAFFTDRGFEATVACQQVLGGHGYIKDYGIEHFVRNSRIAQLYEGANGVQAMDLVLRKLTAHGGRAQQAFLNMIGDAIASHEARPELAVFTGPLQMAHALITETLQRLDTLRAGSPDAVAAAAYDLLTAMGILYVGWNWLEMVAALVGGSGCNHATPEMLQVKPVLARVWMQRQIPLIEGLCDRIACGNDSLMALPDALI